MEIKKGEKSTRLKNLESRLKIIVKSKNYLEEELSRINEKKKELEKHIRKEKEAIALSRKVKRLRR